MTISGLDDPCPACERPAGDHTLREWAACLGETTTELPYAAVPDDLAGEATKAIQERFGLDEDLFVADHVVVRAATLDGASGVIGIKVPALIHEYQIGLAGKPPATVAKILYVGEAEAMRAYGRLVRDSANGAANATERQ